MTGEKAQEILEDLISRGEITVDQGREFNQELKHRAKETVADIRDQNLYDRIAALDPSEREALLEKLGELKPRDLNDEEADPVEE